MRFTWGRGEILKAAAAVLPSVPGAGAVEAVRRLETWVDRYIGERCLDLDPVNALAIRRISDGRSVEIAPTDTRYTTPSILDQETRITLWADHALTLPAQPSSTIPADTKLDVAQRDVAAAVAGHDPLVLVIGPAGTGKTTSLRAAVDDLQLQGRGEILAVATTAKAAGELHDAIGIPTDTLAKLLHTYANPHPQHGVEPRLRLPVGGTVIVDEAGMVNTGDLAQLAELADAHRWRVVLVGDPYQLAAVGRSGMFAHLTSTASRVHELATVRRFVNEWEAATSLKLRLGNVTALDAYDKHRRLRGYERRGDVVDDTVLTWADHQRAGRPVAISVTTRDEAREINTAIQAWRTDLGHLGDLSVPGRDGYRLHTGDVIATRQNSRDLVTDRGEWVKNRAVWTVNALHDDGSITATGTLGSVRLPGDYTRHQVELAYASTTYGTIGGTFDASISVIAPGAHARGLYTAITRGHDHNLVIVHLEPGQALLDRLAIVMHRPRPHPRHHRLPDRPDLQRLHQLSPPTRAIPPPSPATPKPDPAPVPVARAAVPAWFPELVTDLRGDLDRAHAQQRQIEDRRRLATVEYTRLEPVVETARQAAVIPRREVADAYDRQQAAQHRVWDAYAAKREARGFLDRRRTDRAALEADAGHNAAKINLAEVRERHQPVISRHDQLVEQLAKLGRDRGELSFDRYRENPEMVQQKLEALGTWHGWAVGKPVTEAELVSAVTTIRGLAAGRGQDWGGAGAVPRTRRNTHRLGTRARTPHPTPRTTHAPDPATVTWR